MNENPDASGFSGNTINQPSTVETKNHLMYCWRSDAEVSLHVRFSGWPAVKLRIGMNKSQVLALFFGEPSVRGMMGFGFWTHCGILDLEALMNILYQTKHLNRNMANRSPLGSGASDIGLQGD